MLEVLVDGYREAIWMVGPREILPDFNLLPRTEGEVRAIKEKADWHISEGDRELYRIAEDVMGLYHPGHSDRPFRFNKYQIFVYFIQAGDYGPIKIGFSNNPYRRAQALQVANPELLRVVLTYPAKPDTERDTHRLFRKFKIGGEWYHPQPALVEYIKRARIYLYGE
jgi:hypothetical protein